MMEREHPPQIATFRFQGEHYIRGGSALARSFDVMLNGEALTDSKVAAYNCEAGLVWLYELDERGAKQFIEGEPLIALCPGLVMVRWRDPVTA